MRRFGSDKAAEGGAMFENRNVILTTSIALFVAASMPLRAQSTNTTSTMNERDVAEVLHVANAGEAQIAGMALQRGSKDKVRQFAQRMQMDHSVADRGLVAAQGN